LNIIIISILLQFSDGYFNDIQPSTIGVDFKVKVMDVVQDPTTGQTKKIKVTVWDTAGQERFRTLTSSYYRGAQGIILVYDVSRRDTFDNLSTWLQEIEQFSPGGGTDIIKFLVGNKADQPRAILCDYAKDWAKNRGLLFLETSAKTKEGISQVFDDIVQKVLLLLIFIFIFFLLLTSFQCIYNFKMTDSCYTSTFGQYATYFVQ